MGMCIRVMDEFVTVRFNDGFDPVDALFQVAAGHAYSASMGIPLKLCFTDTKVGKSLSRYMRNVETHDGNYPDNAWYGYLGQMDMPVIEGGVTLYSRYRSPFLFKDYADSLRSLFVDVNKEDRTLVLLDNIPNSVNNKKGFTSLVWLNYVINMLKEEMSYKNPLVCSMLYGASVPLFSRPLNTVVHQYDRSPDEVFRVIFESACSNIVMAPNLDSWWVKFFRPSIPAVVQGEWPFSEAELNWLECSSAKNTLRRVNVLDILTML